MQVIKKALIIKKEWLEKRLSYEVQSKSIIETPEINIESTLSIRDQSIIDRLKSGQSGISISEETGVDPSTISKLKKRIL